MAWTDFPNVAAPENWDAALSGPIDFEALYFFGGTLAEALTYRFRTLAESWTGTDYFVPDEFVFPNEGILFVPPAPVEVSELYVEVPSSGNPGFALWDGSGNRFLTVADFTNSVEDLGATRIYGAVFTAPATVSAIGISRLSGDGGPTLSSIVGIYGLGAAAPPPKFWTSFVKTSETFRA